MSVINLSVDMGRVQTSVNAAIRPAVEEALATVDVKKIIKDELFRKSDLDDDYYSPLMYLSSRGRRLQRSNLEGMIRDGISELAESFVKDELARHSGEIEEAFRKMLSTSQSKLVKAFGKAAEDALKEDWAFALDVKVSHKTTEKGRDDD